MFKKLGRAFTKNKNKLRIDIYFGSIQGLPTNVTSCRIIWARDSKIQMTKPAMVTNGNASFNEELSIISTLSQNSKGKFEPKLYEFKVQVIDNVTQTFVLLGKLSIDLATYAEARQTPIAMDYPFKRGKARVSATITSTPVAGVFSDPDNASVTTGISGTESKSGDEPAEQDLSEFDIPMQELSTDALDYGAPPKPRTTASVPEHAVAPSGASKADEETERLKQHLATVRAGSAGATPQTKSGHTLKEENERLLSKVSSLEETIKTLRNSKAGGTVSEEYVQREKELEAEIAHLQQALDELREQNGVEELEIRLEQAEAAAAEAEAVAEEAVAMLETAQKERHQFEQDAAQLRRDLEWKDKKALKDRANWEGRINDSFKKMEGTVLLAERVQREKAEVQAQLAKLATEKASLEELTDPVGVEKKVKLAVEKARVELEVRLDIERQSLLKRIKDMEEFVDAADARALSASAKTAQLEADLTRNRGGSDEWVMQVRAAEERADALSLELQYAQAEKRQLQQKLDAIQTERQTASELDRRQKDDLVERISELESELETSRDRASRSESSAKEYQQKMSNLEMELEGSKLELAALEQSLASGTEASVAGGGDRAGDEVVNSADPDGVVKEGVSTPGTTAGGKSQAGVRELQQSLEARTARIKSLQAELSETTASLHRAERERDAARSETGDLRRQLRASDDQLQRLNITLTQSQAQVQELERAQRELIATATSTFGTGKREIPDALQDAANAAGVNVDRNVGQQQEESTNPSSSTAGFSQLQRQLQEGQQLAEFATAKAADLIMQLAESQSDNGDKELRVQELREEIARLRSGPDGELRGRIESLERELQVAKNRADVNVLLREEHQRIAQDLIAAKVGLAESQEMIVKLKRALMKSQERSMALASRLTKMETKMYRRLTNVVTRKNKSNISGLHGEGSGASLSSLPSSIDEELAEGVEDPERAGTPSTMSKIGRKLSNPLKRKGSKGKNKLPPGGGGPMGAGIAASPTHQAAVGTSPEVGSSGEMYLDANRSPFSTPAKATPPGSGYASPYGDGGPNTVGSSANPSPARPVSATASPLGQGIRKP